MVNIMHFTVNPIAFVSALRHHAEDDYWGNEQARITLVEALPTESLTGLAEFSHVEVIFVFHQVEEDRINSGARHPRNNPAWPAVGIFAQRGKNRPNRLGSTICKLVAVEGRSLLVTELDAVDGTPVLDIKPVMSEFLPRESVVQAQWSKDLMVNYWRVKERQ
jgi:tRNA-Thr(GGU) m(6)t(6)A37 methyltransferase TsaA